MPKATGRVDLRAVARHGLRSQRQGRDARSSRSPATTGCSVRPGAPGARRAHPSCAWTPIMPVPHPECRQRAGGSYDTGWGAPLPPPPPPAVVIYVSRLRSNRECSAAWVPCCCSPITVRHPTHAGRAPAGAEVCRGAQGHDQGDQLAGACSITKTKQTVRCCCGQHCSTVWKARDGSHALVAARVVKPAWMPCHSPPPLLPPTSPASHPLCSSMMTSTESWIRSWTPPSSCRRFWATVGAVQPPAAAAPPAALPSSAPRSRSSPSRCPHTFVATC